MVRGVELGELIAEGAFGAVYRAVQPQIGREVAVKVVRPELADDPEFIRSFEFEAQVVARLEHPHIVPLYDYWREPGGAFLVMRFVRGGTAEQALAEGRADLELVVRLVGQVGGALTAAHEARVLHRDVKPSNVLLDERGDTYLTDFGIAVDATATGRVAGSVGSPLYVAPEQAAGGAVDERSDLYGLAVVVFELLAGQPPVVADSLEQLMEAKTRPPRSLSELRPDLPVRLSEVLDQALSPAPDQRFASVVEFVNAVLSAAPGSAAGAVTTSAAPGAGARSTLVRAEVEVPNPYRGLLAFSEADAGGFHGRDGLVNDLVEAVGQHRFVTVVGASGSGKSSVVRAGLLPRLRRGALDGSAGWFITTIAPGAHPVEQLEAGLFRMAANVPENLLELLQSGERGLARVLKHVLPENGTLLLVVDQFEELFTLTKATERNQVLEALAAAVADPDSQLRVIATVRADFYDGPLSHPAIGELVQTGSVPVPPMNQAELTNAITLPAQTVGVTFEPALVTRMITDVHGAPGSLPLLQYTLTELFDQRDSTVITETAYDQIGGITGALATQAETIYTTLAADAQAASRRMFGRLVNLGEGTEDTRRRIDQPDVTSDAATQAVLDAYGSARLLSFDRNPHTRTPTIEVAHEALIREWPRLRQWLDEDRDQLRALNHLSQAAQAWNQRGRNTDDLYRGARLDTALELRATNTNLTRLETDYIAASSVETDREVVKQRRSNRRLRVLLSLAACLLVIAVGAGLLAQRSSQRADRNAADAGEQRVLADQRARQTELDRLVEVPQQLATRDPALAALLAVESFRLRGDAVAAAALLGVVGGAPRPNGAVDVGRGDQRALSPDGGTLLVVSDGTATLLDTATGAPVADPFPALSEDVSIDVSLRGSRVAVLDRNSGRLQVVEPSSGRTVLEGDAGDGVTNVSISANGLHVAVGTSAILQGLSSELGAAQASIWDVETGVMTSNPLSPAHVNAVDLVAVADDGSTLFGGGRAFAVSKVTGSGERVSLGYIGLPNFDEQTLVDGTVVRRQPPPPGTVIVHLLADGEGFILGSESGLVTAWRPTTPLEEYGQLFDNNAPNGAGHVPAFEPVNLSQHGAVTALASTPDGAVIAAGTSGGAITILDRESGAALVPPTPIAASAIEHLAIDGDRIVAATAAGLVSRWTVDLRGPAAQRLPGAEAALAQPIEDRLLAGSSTGQLEVRPWPLDARPAQVLTYGHIVDIEAAPSGELAAVVTADFPCESFPPFPCGSQLRLISLADLDELGRQRLPTNGTNVPIAFAPSGETLAAGTVSGFVQLLDAATADVIDNAGGFDVRRAVTSISYVNDETLLTAHADGTLGSWEIQDGQLTEADRLDTGDAAAVTVLPKGRIGVGTRSGAVIIYSDTSLQQLVSTLKGHSQPIEHIDIHPETNRLATSDRSTVVVWDLESGTNLLLINQATNGRFGQDGRLFTSTPQASPILAPPAVWNLDLVSAETHACELAARNLSEEEWARHLPTDEPYRETCTGLQ